MTTKEQLIYKIKQWIQHDDNIKNLQGQIKTERLGKRNLTNELIEIMKTNEIDCFDINNGKIIFCKNKIKTPLTKKSLIASLEKYFSKIPAINHTDVSQFILDDREILIKENIRRK